MSFAYPLFLGLLLLIPVWIWRLFAAKRTRSAVKFSDIGRLRRIGPSLSLRLRHCVPLLRIAAAVLLIVALARPRTFEDFVAVRYTEGVDIIIALDVSGSMDAEDMELPEFRNRNDLMNILRAGRLPTRLEVAKEVIRDFVAGRRNDRIGLVVFAREAFIRCPMTLDYGMFTNLLAEVPRYLDQEMRSQTAIATSIARCVNRLRHSEAESRVIVFLTDGMENFPGQFDQLTAAELARAMGIRIYTIGVGSNSVTPRRIDSGIFGERIVFEPVQIDEKTLRQIAEITGGQYYRAFDRSGLESIFEAIDGLEKSEIETDTHRRYRELYPWFVIPALILLMVEQLLANTRFRTLP